MKSKNTFDKMKNKVHLLWPISFGLFFVNFCVKVLAKEYPMFIEYYYSRGLYKIITRVLTGFTNLFPFSIGEILFLLLIVFLLYHIIHLIVVCLRKNTSKLSMYIRNFVFIVACINLSFTLLWSLNNYRLPVKDIMGFNEVTNTNKGLIDTYQVLIEKTNDYRNQMENVAETEVDLTYFEMIESGNKGYEVLASTYPFINKRKVVAKPLILSPYQTKAGYSGVYLFFSGEATFNYKPLNFRLPHTICHEIAHQKGFAKEDEANYLGFLACKYHDHVVFKYSGYLAALGYVGNAVYREDPETYIKMTEQLSQLVKNDLKNSKEFWESNIVEKPSKFVNQLNDAYLKSNNQPEGVKSYGLVVDLLVADYLQDHEI